MPTMGDVFRVVRVSDQHEIDRSIDLVGACVKWVKNPNQLRVEQLEAGSTTATRVVPRVECCDALRQWLPASKHTSEGERADMAQFIQEACSGPQTQDIEFSI